MHSDKNLEYLSTVIDRNIFDVITAYIRSQRKETQRTLIQIIYTFIEILRQPINSRNTTQLAENLEYIRSYFCDKHTYNTAESKYNTLLALIKYLIKQGIFAKSPSVPKRLSKTGEYDLYKRDIIPISVLKKIKVYPSAKEIFDNTIDKLCPPGIAKRLKEHVNTFKNKKHHRAPILQFIIQISSENPEWYNHPKIIQGGLLKFRNSLLNSKQRNTSYGNYQNVKNSIEVLIEHHLLSSEIELPGNLRRCTNAAKIRDSNPIISEFNIYEDHNRLKFRNSQEFLKDLEKDIRENLNIIITEAATIIQESYKIFLSKKEIVKKSQQQEFINHPRMRVKSNTNQKTVKKELNPFYSTHPLCLENKLAALDHFLELVAHKKEIPNSAQLNGKPELYKYLGLTPLVASAMQIVIVEELGINPHSLYNIKVNSDGHGLEYVKETDQGDVRLKAIKPRARMARTMQANGTLVRLSEQEACNINAATCFKMAIEMTSELRKHVDKKELWLCLSKDGISHPSSNTFINNFNKIRNNVAQKKDILREATLKKIRISKAILLYLESRGDSLKAATYLGNKVKTTLNSYIPDYLSELVYRIKMRSFQNILLFMAVSSDDSPGESLNLTDGEFTSRLKQAFSNPDMGGNLYQALINGDEPKEDTNTVFFCVSELNIELAIRYARNGSDRELREDCATVLEKIAAGPVILRQLLRKAQRATEQNEVNN